MTHRKRIGIIGGAGFTGQELIRILSPREDVEIAVCNSQTFSGKAVAKVFPHLDVSLRFTDHPLEEIKKMQLDALFLAVTNGEGMKIASEFTQEKTKIIDLCADHRFQDINMYEKVYGISHENPQKAVYGLPELFEKEIKNADLIANPGCYATACLLSVLPLLHEKCVHHAVFDGKSGVSGAGARHADVNNFNTLSENILAYKISDHRHTKEIGQFCDFPISFTPHIIPVMRGMMVTTHLIMNRKCNETDILKKYKEYYAPHPHVSVDQRIPTMREVQMNDRAVIGGFEADEYNRLVIVTVIDNLGKGASGQAVQNFDLLFS
jgi:N-acetyl-gamma-glutamyl-phosphate reductase